jgi:hypothetical protein
LLFLICGVVGAQQPPCGTATSPAYPAIDAPPVVQVWKQTQWTPPACTGWEAGNSVTLVATVARFRYTGGAAALRGRIGAISQLKGLLYWSATEKRWQPLIVGAAALAGADAGGRADFQPEEITAGRSLWAEEEDNLLGKGKYRIRIVEASNHRLVFGTENTTTLRFLGLPVFAPGEIRTICFLDREAKDVWRYYALARMGKAIGLLVSGHEASLINRAVASFRFLAGIPANQEPPAAR